MIGTLFSGPRHHKFYPGILYLIVIIFSIVEIPAPLLEFPFQEAFAGLKQGYLGDPAATAFFRQLIADNYLAADYLKPKLAHKDKIEFLGSIPLLPYLLPRALPSRFCCPQDLLFMPNSGNATKMQKQWIQEYTSAVIQARPRFFIIQDHLPAIKKPSKWFSPSCRNFLTRTITQTIKSGQSRFGN
jgi:hypothetical protein